MNILLSISFVETIDRFGIDEKREGVEKQHDCVGQCKGEGKESEIHHFIVTAHHGSCRKHDEIETGIVYKEEESFIQ